MATKNKKTTMSDRAQTRVKKENRWQIFEAEAKFISGDMAKCLKTLADAIFPNNEYNSQIYQEAIAGSLIETISPDLGIYDFWKALKKDDCETVKIENGHMNFYTKKSTKIDITKYTQPIIFPATSSLDEQRKMERTKKIAEAKKQLEELIKEIKNKKITK